MTGPPYGLYISLVQLYFPTYLPLTDRLLAGYLCLPPGLWVNQCLPGICSP